MSFSVLEYFPFKSIHVLQRISCFVALSNAKPPGAHSAPFVEMAATPPATFAKSALERDPQQCKGANRADAPHEKTVENEKDDFRAFLKDVVLDDGLYSQR